jgi:starch synthase
MRKRILIISQEIDPYIQKGSIASHVLEIAKQVKKNKSAEVRLFMPKYGCVNERRHQLHEVIRLSGVNIVVNDIDQPLIVKVASIPQARLQVYFIDNEEYFQRKQVLTNSNDELLADNDERMMFFCRGVLETLQMLGWAPDIIHCHGWMTSLLPMYLKNIYNSDSVFSSTKIITSFYKESFKGQLDKNLLNKILFDGIPEECVSQLSKPNANNLYNLAAQFSDGIVLENEYKNQDILDLASSKDVPLLQPQEDSDYYDYYESFFLEELV